MTPPVQETDMGSGKPGQGFDGDGQDVYQLAEKLGVEVFPEEDWYLQIDLDAGMAIEDNVLDLLSRREIIPKDSDAILVTRSRRGKGQHWYIPLTQPRPYPVRCAYQAALGSDPMREARGMRHFEHGTRTPVASLFETPDMAAKVQKWMDKWRPRGKRGKWSCLDGPDPNYFPDDNDVAF